MVGKRRRLLNYLKTSQIAMYKKLVTSLKLKGWLGIFRIFRSWLPVEYISPDIRLRIIDFTNSPLENYRWIKNKNTFNNAKIINIDDSNKNENYGDINIVAPEAVSLSHIVFAKFAEWGFVPNKDISKALLIGLTN